MKKLLYITIFILYGISDAQTIINSYRFEPTYTVVKRVNVGSTSAITATDGDIDWVMGIGTGGATVGNLTVNTGVNLPTTSFSWTRHSSIPVGMPDADFQTLFDSERYDDAAAPEMMYTISSLTAGIYKLRIYVGESNGSYVAGNRVFTININGVATYTSFDPTSYFGGNRRAGMLEYDVTIAGTTLTVEWIHVTQNPIVNGLELLKQN